MSSRAKKRQLSMQLQFSATKMPKLPKSSTLFTSAMTTLTMMTKSHLTSRLTFQSTKWRMVYGSFKLSPWKTKIPMRRDQLAASCRSVMDGPRRPLNGLALMKWTLQALKTVFFLKSTVQKRLMTLQSPLLKIKTSMPFKTLRYLTWTRFKTARLNCPSQSRIMTVKSSQHTRPQFKPEFMKA